MAYNQILRSDLQVLLDKYRKIRDVSEEPYLLYPLAKADTSIGVIDTFDTIDSFDFWHIKVT